MPTEISLEEKREYLLQSNLQDDSAQAINIARASSETINALYTQRMQIEHEREQAEKRIKYLRYMAGAGIAFAIHGTDKALDPLLSLAGDIASEILSVAFEKAADKLEIALSSQSIQSFLLYTAQASEIVVKATLAFVETIDNRLGKGTTELAFNAAANLACNTLLVAVPPAYFAIKFSGLVPTIGKMLNQSKLQEQQKSLRGFIDKVKQNKVLAKVATQAQKLSKLNIDPLSIGQINLDNQNLEEKLQSEHGQQVLKDMADIIQHVQDGTEDKTIKKTVEAMSESVYQYLTSKIKNDEHKHQDNLLAEYKKKIKDSMIKSYEESKSAAENK